MNAYPENIKEILKTATKDRSSFVAFSLKPDNRELMENLTAWMDVLDLKPRLRHRVFMVMNDVTKDNYPLCRCGCGKPVGLNFTYHDKGYRDFHDATHSRKTSRLPKESLEKLKDRDWLYDHRVIKKLSLQNIADLLGCSEIPVIRWCKKHKIEFDSKRKSTIQIDQISKEELEEYYKTHSMDEIAKMFGTSKSKVSLLCEKFEIQAKKSNDYPRKFVRVSKQENELLQFVKSIYSGNVIGSARGIIPNAELDIYMPDLNLAIEFNGIYHHRFRPNEEKECLRKGQNYHLNKTLSCNKKGIRLIHIFSDEWTNKKEIVKSMISYRIGIVPKKIFARKCDIMHVSKVNKDLFLNENHLQGKDRSKIRLGLFDGKVLVAIMTFSASRFHRSHCWELVRYAVLRGNSVIGGFSKLLKHFMKYHPGTVISYADRRYSEGDVYSKNGFKLIKTNRPAYHYIHKSGKEIRYNRMNFQKKKLLKELGETDSSLTELELASRLGYSRIYDCGTFTYVHDTNSISDTSIPRSF